ncbi:hypothetical protein ACFRJ1_32950 [Streptomyces sp. NPDC056773]|uniref:hypothetical protein n=1 Tax=unclassified Streptomyces TaxID=2593676 RepID=UPI0036A08985
MPSSAPPPAAGADAAVGQARRERVEAARTALAEAGAEAEHLEVEQAAARERVEHAAATVAEAEDALQAAKERLEAARRESRARVAVRVRVRMR